MRTYLTELFDSITEMNNTDDTEYEDDEFDGEGYQEDETPEPEVVAEVHSEPFPQHPVAQNPNATINRGYFPRSPFLGQFVTPPNQPPPSAESRRDVATRISAIFTAHYRTTPDRAPSTDLAEASTQLTMHAQSSSMPMLVPSRGPPAHRQHRNVADALPIIESSASPSPTGTPGHVSAAASDNGAGFFRSYNERPGNPLSPLGGDGTLTPDLNFAEIGHGRGAQSAGTSTNRLIRTSRQPPMTRPSHDRTLRRHSSVEYASNQTTVESTDQGTRAFARQAASSSVNQELQESVQMAFNGQPRGRQEQGSWRRPEPRARSVRRQIKNTIHAAGSLFNRTGPSNEGGGSGSSHPNSFGTNSANRPR